MMENRLNQMKEETTEYKKRMAQRKHKLLLDSLTQVFNRAAFDEQLRSGIQALTALSDRYAWPSSVSTIKSINDRFGHLWGGKALKVIARP